MPSMTSSLAYLTAGLPGIGGVIKQRAEDFLVDELPLYDAVGEGEHMFVMIEKRGQTTTDVMRRVAKLFHVPRSEVGYAGLKDKHAVTRQQLSVHLPDPSNDEKFLGRFEYTPFKLLWARRHHNKLRRGHLAGNRFVIHIRSVDPTAAVRAREVVDHLVKTGVPNYVGRQRFGYRQTNHELGRLLALSRWQPMLDLMLGGPIDTDSPATREGRDAYDRGDFSAALEVWPMQLRHDRQALDALRQGKGPRQAIMSIDNHQREFLISALQSAMFNDVLDQRSRDGLFSRLVEGDLAFKHDNRSVFGVDRATAEVENAAGGRFQRLEISPSGPMWGADMTEPTGRPLEWELRVLDRYGLSRAVLKQADHIPAYGSRRAMRVILRSPEVSGGADEHGSYVRLVFDLTRGSFATVVLREIMKKDGENESPRSRPQMDDVS